MSRFLVNSKISNVISQQYQNCLYFPKNKTDLIEIIDKLISKGEYDLNVIDTSDITDMSNLFGDFDVCRMDNIDVSNWNVSNVNNMRKLFFMMQNFNCDLSKWNVSNVEDMQYMFYGCYNFNNDISDWNVKNVKCMAGMFIDCKKFEGKYLSKWNTKSLYNATYMFKYCKSLNTNISTWSTDCLVHVDHMFDNVDNCNIPDWYYVIFDKYRLI